MGHLTFRYSGTIESQGNLLLWWSNLGPVEMTETEEGNLYASPNCPASLLYSWDGGVWVVDNVYGASYRVDKNDIIVYLGEGKFGVLKNGY